MGKEQKSLPKVLQGKVIQEVDIPPGTQLLEDVCYLEYRPEDLHEGDGEGKRPYLKGRLGLVDAPTANRRLYRRPIMAREIARLAEDMSARGVYGELGHPGDGKTDMQRVSHFVLGAEITESGEILGVLEFIPGTRNGDQALAIARAGGRLGVSSRGFGSIAPDNKGNHVVQEDYKLVTWDIVGDPANAGAHPNFVVEEKENGMDLETLKKENTELYEQIVAEVKTEAEEEAREHAREALREDFEEQLRVESEKLREEAVEKAREQLLNDPTVAGAATAVERIKEVMTPFVLDEDESKELASVRQKLSDAHTIIAERDERIKELDEENEELLQSAKEFGLLLHLERELAENERREQIEGMLGDVNDFADLNELSARMEEIAESLAEEDAKIAEYEERIAELETNNVKLSEERDQALGIGQKFGIRAYVERKIADHPHRIKLRNFLNESAPGSPEDVDRLVETFTAANPVSREFQKIQSDLSGPGGKESRGRQRRGITEDVGIEQDVSTVGGVSMAELAKRANAM